MQWRIGHETCRRKGFSLANSTAQGEKLLLLPIPSRLWLSTYVLPLQQARSVGRLLVHAFRKICGGGKEAPPPPSPYSQDAKISFPSSNSNSGCDRWWIEKEDRDAGAVGAGFSSSSPLLKFFGKDVGWAASPLLPSPRERRKEGREAESFVWVGKKL